MNEKAARLARQVNRAVGTLAKRTEGAKLPHKIPRKVKRFWDGMTHRMRGRTSRYWKSVMPRREPVVSSVVLPLQLPED